MTDSGKKKAISGKARAPAKQMSKKRRTREKVTKEPTPKEPTATRGEIKRLYLKSRNTCKVTFRLPRTAAKDAKSVSVVGDFNNWNIHANPMKRLRNGEYTTRLELEPGREYQFRYLIDGSKWENDWNADKYLMTPYGDSDNSVVIV
jgi:1,4-alpha-glucan branching enzyme